MPNATTQFPTAQKLPCVLCGADSAPVLQVRGYEIAECHECAHRFLTATLPTDHVQRVYSDDYFFGGGAGYTDYLGQEKLLIDRGKEYAKRVEKALGRTGSLLDVGAAAGFLLQGWESRGWNACGIEPNLSMVQHGQKRGLDLRHGVFQDSGEFPKNTFDCVSMIQVISHMPQPREAISYAFDLLKPGGVLLIETWDRKSWMASVMRSGWHEYSPPSVLHWFHPGSLKNAAHLAGFEFIQSKRALRWLNLGHAKSLLRHCASTSALASMASSIASILPDRGNILYPGDDLFWALFRKPA